MRNGTLYTQFGDLLKEVPEAEDALRKWRQEEALRIVRKRNEERRQRRLDEALRWLCERSRAARAARPDSFGE
jgi:hypothetical protein